MKRISLIPFLLLALLLCACGDVATPTVTFQSSDTVETTDVPVVVAGVSDPILLAFCPPSAYDISGDYLEKLDEKINDMLYEQGEASPLMLLRVPDETIDPKIEQEEGLTVINMIDAGDALRSYAESERATDITDTLRLHHPELLEAIPERAWKETMIDGRIYGVPLPVDAFGTEDARYGFDMWPGTLDLLDAAMPESPEELIEELRTAKENGESRTKLLLDPAVPPYPLHRTYPEWPFFVDEQMRYVLYIDGIVGPYVGSEIFRRDAAFLSVLVKEDLLLSSDDAVSDQLQGSIFASFYPLRASNFFGDNDYEDYNPLITTTPEVGVFAPSAAYARFGLWANKVLFISQTCANTDAALSMIAAIYTNPEIANRLATPLEERYFPDENAPDDRNRDRPSWAFLVNEGGRPVVGTSPNYPSRLFHASFRFEPSPSASADKTTVFFPGGGFSLDETAIDQPPWWKDAGLPEVIRLLSGGIPAEAVEEEMRDVLEKFDTHGYELLLGECQRQLTEYIERCQ